ncbi:hypothetical protein OUZ56_016470 [Daphnia magna]|uniref:Uncharacterized protein n=1 Tax=Daphnia magna TaxID=35525 RepID=A0ABR0AQR2_9CRUS|nr:hypothetical protein OUZ56_016470 [Daphnia magna]
MDHNVHSSDPLNVEESNLECNITDVQEGKNEHCFDSLNFMKSEILKLKMESEMLETDKQ